ncbi:MAG: hypothetical protein GXY05_13790 [Clostridiales bacterium]|nr:hypothetical protein [Clostridiales bacterium]
MFNSQFRYSQDIAEAMSEDAEGTAAFLESERQKAYASYKPGDEARCCCICGEPLVKNSVSYYEGFHIDSCV